MLLPESEDGITRQIEHAALARLSAAGLLAYCSYTICRTPLLPLFARDLGADAPLVGLVVGASTLTGIVLKLPAGASASIPRLIRFAHYGLRMQSAMKPICAPGRHMFGR